MQGSFTPPENATNAAMSPKVQTHMLDVKGALPKGGVRLTTGPALGEIIADTNASAETEDAGPSNKRKRKRDDEGAREAYHEREKTRRSTDAPQETKPKKRKRSQQSQQDQITVAESNDAQNSGQSKKAKKRQAKKDREHATEKKALRKAKRATIARDNALRNRAREAVERGEAKVSGTTIEPTPDPETQPVGPIHEQSILARRQKGEKIDLPGDENDPDTLRFELIRCIEEGQKGRMKSLLTGAFKDLGAQKQSQKTKGKAVFKAKQAAKRDARRWVNIRANPHLFRPDGNPFTAIERGITEKDIAAEVDAQKRKKRWTKEERRAEKQAKEEEQKVQDEKAASRLAGIVSNDEDGDYSPSEPDSDNGDAEPDASDHPTTDYMELEPSNDFIVDTVGDASNLTDPSTPKRIKDMTRAERQARREEMRQRRAANAAEGTTKLSKKERGKVKVGKADARINRIADDLLEKASREAKAQGLPDWTRPSTRDEQNLVRENALKEAKQIAKAIKKGKIPQEEIMAEWQIGVRGGGRGRKSKRAKE